MEDSLSELSRRTTAGIPASTDLFQMGPFAVPDTLQTVVDSKSRGYEGKVFTQNMLPGCQRSLMAFIASRAPGDLTRIGHRFFCLPILPISANLIIRAGESRRVRTPVLGKNDLFLVRNGLHTAAPLRSHLPEAGLPIRTTRRGVAKWQCGKLAS
jgi:hypothetical protein